MRTRWFPVLGLAVLAPVCAEYLWGYDDSTGDPLLLIGNLLVFLPLYGCPALLIREVARRRGLGWPGILLLAAAFGVVEAGLVDQSMFSQNYRDIPYWAEMSVPTYVEPIGLSIFLAVTFVAGHVINSIAAPIALVEAMSGRGQEPWLGRPMIVVATLLYLAASGLVLRDMFATEADHATADQLIGAAVVVVLLVAAAFRVGGRPASRHDGVVPAPWLVFVGGGIATATIQLLPPSPMGTAAVVLGYAVAVTLVWRLSRRRGWSAAHIDALAGGALVATAALAFRTTPLGDITDQAKYGHNVGLLVLVAVLTVLAVHRSQRAGVRGSDVPA